MTPPMRGLQSGQGGLRLDAMRGMIAAARLGGDPAVPSNLGMPADRGHRADAEALGSLATRCTGFDRCNYAVEQVE